MSAADWLDDIEIRLASPMVTYKENATIDAPALVAALRAVLTECRSAQQHVGSVRAYMAEDIETLITAALDAS